MKKNNETIKFEFSEKSLTVSELKEKLQELEDMQYGDSQVYVGCPPSMGIGSTTGRAVKDIGTNGLYSTPFAYISLVKNKPTK